MEGRNGDQPVDNGSIVFNYANYLHLTRMFMDLDVPAKTSDISFGASIEKGRVEYGASRTALMHLGENNYADLRGTGVKVSGAQFRLHQDPPDRQNDFKMPFIQTPEQAADHVLAAMQGGAFFDQLSGPVLMAFQGWGGSCRVVSSIVFFDDRLRRSPFDQVTGPIEKNHRCRQPKAHPSRLAGSRRPAPQGQSHDCGNFR